MSSTLVELLHKPAVVHSLIAIAMMIYGGNNLLVKMAISAGVEPFVMATLRCAGGSLFFMLLMVLVPRLGFQTDKMNDTFSAIMSIPQKDARKILLLGVLMAFNTASGFLAISLLSAVTASLGAPFIPVVTAVLGSSFGVEQITLVKMVGIVVSVCGALVVVVWGEEYNAGSVSSGKAGAISQAIGYTVLMMHLVAISASVVLQKPLLHKYPPVFLCCASYTISTLILAVLGIWQVGLDINAWSLGGNPMLLGVLAYLVVLTTGFNYTALAWGNKMTSPTVLTTYSTLVPVTTAILSWLLLGKLLTIGQAAGGSIIVAGLICNVRSQIPDADDAASKPLTAQP